MGTFINDKGYICYVRSGIRFSDTHGGHEELHRIEQEEVVNEIVNRKLEIAMESIEQSVKQMIDTYAAQVWKGLIASLKDVLNEDIIAEVSIGFNNAGEIFNSSKAQEYFRKNIYNAIEKELRQLSNCKVTVN